MKKQILALALALVLLLSAPAALAESAPEDALCRLALSVGEQMAARAENGGLRMYTSKEEVLAAAERFAATVAECAQPLSLTL